MYDNGWGRTRRRDDAVIFSHSRVKKSVNTKNVGVENQDEARTVAGSHPARVHQTLLAASDQTVERAFGESISEPRGLPTPFLIISGPEP